MRLEELPIEDKEEFEKAVASLSCDELRSLFEEGAKVLEGEEVVHLDPSRGVLFHGDIHGDIDTLYAIWERVGIEDVLDSFKLVFLGDYVDRGPKQVEALLLVLALKARRPEEVVVLRGNHEPPSWLPVSPHDFPDVLESLCPGSSLYDAARKAFDAMPLAARVGDVVALHGGPPASKVLGGCEGDECLRGFDREAVEEVLWSDPDELVGGRLCNWDDPGERCVEPNYVRGAGRLWGPGLTREFIERVGASAIVRGHTAVDGFALCHNNKVMTLFTRLGDPYYNANAAVLLMKGKKLTVIPYGGL